MRRVQVRLRQHEVRLHHLQRRVPQRHLESNALPPLRRKLTANV